LTNRRTVLRSEIKHLSTPNKYSRLHPACLFSTSTSPTTRTQALQSWYARVLAAAQRQFAHLESAVCLPCVCDGFLVYSGRRHWLRSHQEYSFLGCWCGVRISVRSVCASCRFACIITEWGYSTSGVRTASPTELLTVLRVLLVRMV
jgi:hypothetical protein